MDSHHAHARERGAAVVAEPEDKPWGLRQHTAKDLEGHRWEFSQYLRAPHRRPSGELSSAKSEA